MQQGYMKVAAGVPAVRVADCRHNCEAIERLWAQADGRGVELLALPELSLTGYTCQDLFQQQLLLDEAEAALLSLVEFSRGMNSTAVVGLPVSYGGRLYNCAAVVRGGRLWGLVPKTFIPNYAEFYEARWFASAATLPQGLTVRLCGGHVPMGQGLLFQTEQGCFGVELCEDLWTVCPPSGTLALGGAEVIVNLSASNECVGKHAYVRSLVSQQSARCLCGYVYTSSGWGESTQDLVFSGRSLVCENGSVLCENARFSMREELLEAELDMDRLRALRLRNTSFAAQAGMLQGGAGAQGGLPLCGAAPRPTLIDLTQATSTTLPHEVKLQRVVDPLPFVPGDGPELAQRCEEIVCIQSEGLARRLEHTHARSAVVGISGGLDSTLALLVTVHAFDRLGLSRTGILGVTMPGFGTTGRTYRNALQLMKLLGVTVREINIQNACLQHFSDIGQDPDQHDVVYENTQARERTQILMDLANQTGGLVVGTGDLSELALGWATYNGDHISMYGVNASVPKTLVRHLVSWFATRAGEDDAASEASAVLRDIIDTPVSPELLPADQDGDIAQRTEDLVGPYELHDFFLYHTLRFGLRPGKIYHLARRAFGPGHSDRVQQHTDDQIKHWLTVFFRRFFQQQFKRSCLPDGPKVGSCSLSPRGDWRMPSDAQARAWLEECEAL